MLSIAAKCFSWMLQEPKVKVDQKDPGGMSALMHAAEIGHMHVAGLFVAFLLFRRLDVALEGRSA